MKPKEKAKYLVDRFQYLNYQSNGLNYQVLLEPLEAKQCALICAEENQQTVSFIDGCDFEWNYWQEVKKEINKL